MIKHCEICGDAFEPIDPGGPPFASDAYPFEADVGYCGTPWPLQNVWLGVSVEDQDHAWRIEKLLEIEAAVRFVSYEPALSAVDWYPWVMDAERSIDWLIAGAETGPGKRPADTDWFVRAADACGCGQVPFFFKRDSDGNRELDGEMHEEMP